MRPLTVRWTSAGRRQIIWRIEEQCPERVESLQAELETLLVKDLGSGGQLISKGTGDSQAEKDLDAAEEKRQEQYDAMKLRIKYIYESGGDAAAHRESNYLRDITSMLTQAEYSQQVHEYDGSSFRHMPRPYRKSKIFRTQLEARICQSWKILSPTMRISRRH